MSSIIAECRAVLSAAGYRTHLPVPTVDVVYFEDESLLGALYVFDSVSTILEQWEVLQDRFLQDNTGSLSTAPFKAWNCYVVFLSTEAANQTAASDLFAVEENFRGARKIVRAGVRSRLDAETALAPLLHLRRLVALSTEGLQERLSSRLVAIDPALAGLLAGVEPKTIARALVESQ